MPYFIIFLVFLSVIATALPMIPSYKWWIRIFDFPRAQVTVIAFLSIILTLIFCIDSPLLLYTLIPLSIGVISYQSIKMIRYTPFYPIRSPKANLPIPDNSFSVLLANVKMDNDQYGELKEIIRKNDPDLVLLNEVDDKWLRELQELDRDFRYSIKYPQDNTYGMTLYSKLKLIDTKVNFLVDNTIPSIHTKVELRSGKIINFHGLHPEPPKPGSSTYERDTELLIVGKRIKNEDEPAILAGDLNDVAWSATSELFQKRSGLWDPREGRGFFNTYNVFVPFFRYPLDHFFYTKDFLLISLSKLAKFGSDHFPILIKLEFDPKARTKID
ncbi:endonuclease/exonuclease/phosphatase family protein [Litoribacter ruber]|uniref:Endonuclease/exonuclease/phosphatase family protein n=1 Tax=Litoribacter ruber TaxID=702568 RepID=A0AAP2CHY5_9BACT|nr:MULTISPECIES: endonuclease/exonuclease/phosphatase family protein [Litoribacter]MBS9524079.1 endonuclease/exonuclease/phosphatase family protein [Litoribacter alkaliphilus]MBT0811337.1 endonuclease/exonuclease/phosphatase family protein [Litoribacter ruber]